MDKLIKKIDNLQPEHRLVESYENEPTFEDGWNRAIYAVDSLIESEMQWKDQPDEEGWWYYDDGVSDITCYFMEDQKKMVGRGYVHPKNKYFTHTAGGFMPLCAFSGKWQKALKPIGRAYAKERK